MDLPYARPNRRIRRTPEIGVVPPVPQQAAGERKERLKRARRQGAEAETTVRRLLELVTKDVMDVDDPQLREALRSATTQRDQARREVDLLNGQTGNPDTAITVDRIARFATLMRDQFAAGDTAFHRAYLRLFVGEIVVMPDQIVIQGPTSTLANAVTQDSLPPVPNGAQFRPAWRPRRDSTSFGLEG